jgi:hypothetical protein
VPEKISLSPFLPPDRTSDPFFHIERVHLKWDQKNSLIETCSSGVRGVALGKVSFTNRIKSKRAL